METLTLRKMTREEMAFAVELAAKEGWNPGIHDASVFYDTDPDGFLIAFLKDQPVGCISAVSYGPDFGFIGFFIVLPKFRKKGFGLQLGNAALERLQVRTVGIDGVFERQNDYERSGFRFACRNLRFEYRFRQPLAVTNSPLISAGKVRFDRLLEYDRQCFPEKRRSFLEKWLSMPDAYASAWQENGSIKGYGVIRQCRAGYKIGPLFADDSPIARALFVELSQKIRAHVPIYLDIPEINTESLRLVESLGMRQIFGTARMYRGTAPEIALNKIFGITTFELG